MQIRRWLISKNEKQISLLLAIFMGLYCCCSSASATVTTYELGTGDISYTFENLLSEYKASSISYERNTIGYEIEAYNSDLATENYYSINGQYSETLEKQAKLKELRELYISYKEATDDPELLAEINSQIGTIDSQLEQYSNSINSIVISKTEAKLQEEISSFYENKKSLILQEAQNKLTNELLKKSYSLILIKEQQDYYESYQKYLEMVKKVEDIKYQKGLTETTAVDTAKANMKKNILAMGKNNALYTSTLTFIKTETKLGDNIKILLPIQAERKEYNLEQTIHDFEINNTSLAQAQDMKQCYQDYLYANGGTYTLYKQIVLRIQDYQLQLEELKVNIKAYVTDAIFSYGNTFDNLELAEQEVQLTNKNYKVVIAKKEHKKATELDICKANYEVEAAELTYYQGVYDLMIWQNILDNHMYGESVE